MAYAAPPAAPAGGYPVQVTITDQRELSRWWGIPFFGNVVRWVLAIPHLVVLWILGFVLAVWLFLGWIVILLTGRVPGIVVKLLTEYIQRGARIGAYIGFLMPGGYPPLEPGAPTPVDVKIEPTSLEINRLWGIPILGFFVRILVLIPQLIVLSILGMVVGLSLIVLWIPILLTGKYPGWAISLYGAMFRYGTRLSAYLLFLPVPYPPIWF
jgi:hypothetical protein